MHAGIPADASDWGRDHLPLGREFSGCSATGRVDHEFGAYSPDSGASGFTKKLRRESGAWGPEKISGLTERG